MEYSIFIDTPGDADSDEISAVIAIACEDARLHISGTGILDVGDEIDLDVGDENLASGFSATMMRTE